MRADSSGSRRRGGSIGVGPGSRRVAAHARPRSSGPVRAQPAVSTWYDSHDVWSWASALTAGALLANTNSHLRVPE